MKKPYLLLPPLLLLLLATAAQAQSLKVASWNLGWHLDRALAKEWIAACDAPFQLDGETWKPAAKAGPETRPGWQLPWGRNAPVQWDIGQLPPCDVFQVAVPGQAQRAALPVTEAMYAARSLAIGALIKTELAPDVIAFQEVSGAKAIEELLGSGWRVCGYEGHKVQRLAFAWKASLGEGRCEVHWALSLPERQLRDQVRPGLALTLTHDGKALRLLTVHLKSSCVSPLDEQQRTPGRGQLDGDEPNCQVLQAQVAPLEAWIEQQAQGVQGLVWLGDMNRNLSHEASESAELPVRNASTGRTRNLWRELSDGSPALQLLSPQCSGSVEGVCASGKARLLAREEFAQLRGQLGCRNPLGLDHIALAGRLSAAQGAFKQSLGKLGDTLPGQLALSDHCPVAAVISLIP